MKFRKQEIRSDGFFLPSKTFLNVCLIVLSWAKGFDHLTVLEYLAARLAALAPTRKALVSVSPPLHYARRYQLDDYSR